MDGFTTVLIAAPNAAFEVPLDELVVVPLFVPLQPASTAVLAASSATAAMILGLLT